MDDDHDIDDDETATACLKTAGYMVGVTVLSLLMALWMLGLATWRFCCGEW